MAKKIFYCRMDYCVIGEDGKSMEERSLYFRLFDASGFLEERISERHFFSEDSKVDIIKDQNVIDSQRISCSFVEVATTGIIYERRVRLAVGQKPKRIIIEAGDRVTFWPVSEVDEWLKKLAEILGIPTELRLK